MESWVVSLPASARMVSVLSGAHSAKPVRHGFRNFGPAAAAANVLICHVVGGRDGLSTLCGHNWSRPEMDSEAGYLSD